MPVIWVLHGVKTAFETMFFVINLCVLLFCGHYWNAAKQRCPYYVIWYNMTLGRNFCAGTVRGAAVDETVELLLCSPAVPAASGSATDRNRPAPPPHPDRVGGSCLCGRNSGSCSAAEQKRSVAISTVVITA